MKTKTIKDAARGFCSKHNDMIERPDFIPGEDDYSRVNIFLAGDAHGYARAIEEASEGFKEYWDAYSVKTGILSNPDEYTTAKETWKAAKLSAQKEIEELQKEIEELRGQRLSLITVYEEQKGRLIKEVDSLIAKLYGNII